MSYESWTIGDVYDKLEWEGGIEGLLDYGGAEIFTPLGREAVNAARDIQKGMRTIQNIFETYEAQLESSDG